MIHKFLFALLILTAQMSYSQTEQHISGRVVSADFALQAIDILNLVSKKTTITNSAGDFSILAKEGESIMFVSKNYYYKTTTIKQADFDNNNFIISLTKKPEELEEVVVFKMPSIKLSKDKAYEQGKINELVLEKAANTPKNRAVYDGTIENGMTKIIRLLGSHKENTKVEFKEFAKNNCNQNFYLEILKLKTDEINLFLEFCDADSKSKTILENVNVLSLMDFLFAKNTEFKKLPASVN